MCEIIYSTDSIPCTSIAGYAICGCLNGLLDGSPASSAW